MPVELYIPKARLSSETYRLITEGLELGYERTKPLAVDHYKIEVEIDANRVIPELGIGGYCHGPDRISLYVDPENPNFSTDTVERISASRTHETSHLVRMRGPGCGMTLGDGLTFEGLAQVYEIETGHRPSFYSTSLDDGQLKALAVKARPVLNAGLYDRNLWFFGSKNDPTFPRFGGYGLGATLVDLCLQTKGLTAREAMQMSTQSILEPWLTSEIDLNKSALRPFGRRRKSEIEFDV